MCVPGRLKPEHGIQRPKYGDVRGITGRLASLSANTNKFAAVNDCSFCDSWRKKLDNGFIFAQVIFLH